MGAGYVVVALVVVALVVAGVMLSRLGKQRAARHEQVSSARHTLRYDVPAGQDPAAVLVALSRGGFEAVADPVDAHALTVVLPLGSQQREEVRVVLENEAGQTLDPQDDHVPGGPVRFADERSDR
jgi:hypothetical protein